MREHAKTHEKREYTPCEQCGKRFVTKENLSSHLKFVHGNSKLFNCDICEFNSKYPQAIKAHKKWKHFDNVIRSIDPNSKRSCNII